MSGGDPGLLEILKQIPVIVLRRGMFLLEQDGLRWWRRARKAIRQSTRGGGDSHRRD